MAEMRMADDRNTIYLFLLAEYQVLKAECTEYLKLQNQIILLLPLLFCAATMLVIIDWRGIMALLMFPWLSTLLVLPWVQQHYRRMQINSYISDHLEPALDLYGSAYQKMFERAQRSRLIPFQPGTRFSLSAAALSAQWLFIVLDVLAGVFLIGFILFSAAGKQLPLFVLAFGFICNILLLLFKYWLIMLYPWENQLSIAEPSTATIIKEANSEMYPRCWQAVQETAKEFCLPPASQSLNYFNSLYEQLLFVKEGMIEIRDGSVTPQQRLENRKQYVKLCKPGDIVRIPPGVSYIIANPSADQSAVVKHRRILIPELLIR